MWSDPVPKSIMAAALWLLLVGVACAMTSEKGRRWQPPASGPTSLSITAQAPPISWIMSSGGASLGPAPSSPLPVALGQEAPAPATPIRNLSLHPAQRMLTWELGGGASSAGLDFACQKNWSNTRVVSGRGWEIHMSITCLSITPGPTPSSLLPVSPTFAIWPHPQITTSPTQAPSTAPPLPAPPTGPALTMPRPQAPEGQLQCTFESISLCHVTNFTLLQDSEAAAFILFPASGESHM